ncbi:hypothetical protein [Candidatus Tisiphia endosymbiont of Thecophora atra]|uniref:hypothetical protein n=1 Tax=Candidatus Tisiphia endosymbiont of Thecophora atra TaxID=3066258 RepID=UPI00312C9AC2
MYFIECSKKLKKVYRKGFITKEKQQKQKSFIVNSVGLDTRSEDRSRKLLGKQPSNNVCKSKSINYSDSKFQKLSRALKQNIARRKNSQKVHIEDKNKSENN